MGAKRNGERQILFIMVFIFFFYLMILQEELLSILKFCKVFQVFIYENREVQLKGSVDN